MALTKEEVNRKLLHILSGSAIPAVIFYLPRIDGVSRQLPLIMLGMCVLAYALVEFVRLRVPSVQKLFFSTVGGMLRKEESKSLTGATWIFISAFLCALLFRDEPHIAFMALSMFILGDAIAAVVGLSMGRIKIGKKSLEGALANFFLSLVLMTVVFPSLPQLLSSWNGAMPMLIAVVAALSTTLFELFPIRLGSKMVINDNLIVPIITGFLIKWLYPLVGSAS